MGFCFIRLLSECSCAEDHPRDCQAGLTEFRELHWNSPPSMMMVIIDLDINDDEHH
jgi:hypothetical protein